MSAPIYQITVLSQKYYTNYIIFLTFTLTLDIVHLVGFYYKNKNHFHLFHHTDLNAFLPPHLQIPHCITTFVLVASK